MRILFLTDAVGDFVSDPLYVGLSRLLGNVRVVDYPYKRRFHDPDSRVWWLPQRSGQHYSREEILDLLRDNAFDLVCLASFRQEGIEECARLHERVRFPPTVFIEGEDHDKIRHDVVGKFPISLYFKRDYVWGRGSSLQNLAELCWVFRRSRKLRERTIPLPISIVLDTLPELGSVPKEIDVSYRAHACHPRRAKALNILSQMNGVHFSGGLYVGAHERKYKLKAGRWERLITKLWDNSLVSKEDQQQKFKPEAYYRELAASKIGVAIRGGGRSYLRYFEIAAMGTLLLTERPETVIPHNFVDRQHAVYCRADLGDLKALVQYYLREAAEREAIAREGRLHLLKYHTCERRAEYFVEACRRLL